MTIDWTINIGHVITILSLLGGGLLVVIDIRTGMKGAQTRLSAVEGKLDIMTSIMVQLGRQDERLNGVDHRIEDLKTRVDKVERCEMRG